MVVESLEVKNYRNYDTMNIKFDDRINIIYGDNAQGKTNILEALYVCATTRSHRGSRDKEIISFSSEESHIKVIVNKDMKSNRIDMHLKKNKSKGIAVNGIPIKKSVDLFGLINIILFAPEDLNIINDGPSERRKFMDVELCQLDKIYLHNLIHYNKVLVQRGKLLKETGFNKKNLEILDVWDIQLIKYGRELIISRIAFIEKLNQIIFDIHKKLSGNKEELVIKYIPSVNPEEFEKSVADARDKDLKYSITSVGPHRDDIGFYINNNDVRKFGSQGQKRTCALSLKLAEIELVKNMIHDTPILLLDDVLSELDVNRQNFLLDSIGNIQTIITCTGLDEFINNRFHINKIFKVTEGHIFCEN